MKLVAEANARQPSTATLKKARLTFLGPNRSSQEPKGNCVSEKPKK